MPCTLLAFRSQNPKNQLDLHEGRDGAVYVKGLNTFVVKSVEEIQNVLEASVALLGACLPTGSWLQPVITAATNPECAHTGPPASP